MTDPDPEQQLSRLTTGMSSTLAIFAAAELDLAQHIANGTDSLDGLSRASGTHPQALMRLLRYLVSIGVFDQSDMRYRITAMGNLLRDGVPGSRRARLRMQGRFAPAWTQILHSVRTSESGFSKAFGTSLFSHLERNAEDAAIFDEVMTRVHGPESAIMLDAYDFGALGCIADIGGGSGSFLTEALTRHPQMTGILFDRPHVVERSQVRLQEIGLAARCRTVGGNFFESVPPGADAYVLRHILHDWYDEDCIRILRSCRRALGPGGRVLIAEAIIPEDNEPSIAKDFDLAMLVLVGGQERTVAEYRTLLAQAGLEMISVTPTASLVSLVEARASATAAD
jgi:hypothetical protein